MAEEEPILVSPPTQDVAVHVRDYTRFIRLLKYGAIVCLIVAFIVLLLLK
ncbi:MAG TPA: hypothetical protein VNR86_10005 [Sphingomicrobium sp.]|nr:hypothetical protein [Sphingomicrobium sp.]